MKKPSMPWFRRSQRLSLALLLVSTPLFSQGEVRLELDHSTRAVTVTVGGSGRPQTFRPGEAVRVPSGLPVEVLLSNSNSALYSCTVSQEPLSVPELDTLNTFLTGIGGYLPLIGRELAARGGPVPGTVGALETRITDLEQVLRDLDALVDGSTGMRRARLQVITALSRMRLSPGTVNPEVPRDLREWFRTGDRCEGESCQHLTYPAELLEAFDELHLATLELRRARRAAKQAESSIPAANRPRLNEALLAADSIVGLAETASDRSQSVVQDAYALEKLAVRTMRASATVPCEVVEVTWDKGTALTFNVAPLAGDELQPIATAQSIQTKVNVLPRWAVRPAVGLTFLMSPDAEYPTYSASEADSAFNIVESGSQDSRFTYGLTLSLTYRGLDRRHDQGWAVWIPELIVNPLDDVRAVGIGAGFSYGILKIGAGQLFTRHKILNDQQVGDLVESVDALRTRETFGSGKWFVGVSLMGLPPFIPGS